MADDLLFMEHSHLIEKGVSAFLLYVFEHLVRFTSLSLIFLTKNHKYCRLSLRSCDGLRIFLYLCGQNLTNQIEDYV